jgi:RNA polymerase sigma-70 factor (ECF subfamily)
MSSSSDRSADSKSIRQPVDAAATSNEQADVQLMAAAAANDPVAQRIVVERLARRVRKVTGLLCRAAADADDAAQLALIEILKSADSFRVATSLERWAERVTIRTTLRAVRREKSRMGLLERWLPAGVLPWGGPPTQSAVERIGLDALLQQLSRERSQAFALHHALDYTVEEIAELTGTPVGTVKDRLVSARKQLRKLLRAELRGGAGGKLP